MRGRRARAAVLDQGFTPTTSVAMAGAVTARGPGTHGDVGPHTRAQALPMPVRERRRLNGSQTTSTVRLCTASDTENKRGESRPRYEPSALQEPQAPGAHKGATAPVAEVGPRTFRSARDPLLAATAQPIATRRVSLVRTNLAAEGPSQLLNGYRESQPLRLLSRELEGVDTDHFTCGKPDERSTRVSGIYCRISLHVGDPSTTRTALITPLVTVASRPTDTPIANTSSPSSPLVPRCAACRPCR